LGERAIYVLGVAAVKDMGVI